MTGMLIAGERTEGAAGEGLDVVNPATEETIESVPRGTTQDVEAAVDAAHAAFANGLVVVSLASAVLMATLAVLALTVLRNAGIRESVHESESTTA